MTTNQRDLWSREKECTRCPLRDGCTQVVPGHGAVPSLLMFVGEAPGRDEDAVGEPFVGASGQLYDKLLVSADIDRMSVFTTNVCRCRPPGNRKPLPSEIAACKLWLWKEIQAVNPLVIVAMGATAARLLLHGGPNFSVTRVVGHAIPVDYLSVRRHIPTNEGIPGMVFPIFHPSYLLQHGMDKIGNMVNILRRAKEYTEGAL